MKDFLTTSDGSKVEAHRFYRDLEPAIAPTQARQEEAACCGTSRQDDGTPKGALHKLSTAPVKEYGAIFIGNVDAQKLTRTSMAKSVLDEVRPFDPSLRPGWQPTLPMVRMDDVNRHVSSEHLQVQKQEEHKVTADDYAQIQNLIFRYAHLLDAGRWDELGELFSDADVYIAGKLAASHNGAELTAMWKHYVRLYPNGTPRTHHIMSNVTIEPDGDSKARSHSYVLVVQQSDTLPLQPVIAGDYLDRFEKIGDIWRFSERRIGNELFGDLSQHLLVSIETPNDRPPQSWD